MGVGWGGGGEGIASSSGGDQTQQQLTWAALVGVMSTIRECGWDTGLTATPKCTENGTEPTNLESFQRESGSFTLKTIDALVKANLPS